MENSRSNAPDAMKVMQSVITIWVMRVVACALTALICALPPGLARGSDDCPQQTECPLPGSAPPMPTITVLYDNNPHRAEMETDRGFSCLVQGMEKTVLFDTGKDGRVLLANMKLGCVPGKMDAVVISHIHADHAGGLQTVLRQNPQIAAYLPGSFPEPFLRKVKKQGARLITVRGPVKICTDVFSTGEIGTAPPEQALVVRTGRGLVIITGCAHAGIERVVRTAKESFGGEILLVLGGLHLADSSRPEIEAVIAGLKKLGVRHVAPCHCTGNLARRLFKQSFGSGFIDVGVGKVIETEELR